MLINRTIQNVGLIYIKEKKLLVVHPKGKNIFYQPGGKKEKNENDEECLVRELKEELSIDVILSTIKFYATFKAQAHGKPQGVIVTMNCYTAEFSGELKASSEIEEFKYFSYKEKNQTPALGYLIFEDLKAKGLID